MLLVGLRFLWVRLVGFFCLEHLVQNEGVVIENASQLLLPFNAHTNLLARIVSGMVVPLQESDDFVLQLLMR